MSEKSFLTLKDDMIEAMNLTFKSNLIVPSLVILYSSIDSMAWLDCPAGQEDVTRTDFIKWVDQYYLPVSGLMCNSIDLYAARCGILHSSAPTSKLSREGKAKEIFYAWGKDYSAKDLQMLIDKTSRPAIALQVETLIHAFQTAVGNFQKDLLADRNRADNVYARADKILGKWDGKSP